MKVSKLADPRITNENALVITPHLVPHLILRGSSQADASVADASTFPSFCRGTILQLVQQRCRTLNDPISVN
jgi:hypothetical protein